MGGGSEDAQGERALRAEDARLPVPHASPGGDRSGRRWRVMGAALGGGC